jgi:hypothetical protein|nr:MAG TPA: hypothetical protein [Caudoviricetes sp.]
MIDLSTIERSNYQIKLESGEVLEIKKPSQKFLNEILALYEYIQKMEDSAESGLKVIDRLYDILTDIFNSNINGKVFSREDIEKMLDIKMAMAVLQDYFLYVEGELGK